MTIDTNKWRKAIEESDLKPTTKLVLYTLANYMGKDCICHPSISRIAKGCGLKKCMMYRHLNDAEIAGYIKRNKKMKKGTKIEINEYVGVVPPVYSDTPVYCSTPVYSDTQTGVLEYTHTGVLEYTQTNHITNQELFSAEKIEKKKTLADLKPEDFLDYCKKYSITSNPVVELEKFRNYCTSKSKRYKDWVAAFRNWLLNSMKYQSVSNKSPPKKELKGIPAPGTPEYDQYCENVGIKR